MRRVECNGDNHWLNFFAVRYFRVLDNLLWAVLFITPNLCVCVFVTDAIGSPYLVNKFGTLASNQLELNVGEITPLLLQLATKVLPVALNNLPVHIKRRSTNMASPFAVLAVVVSLFTILLLVGPLSTIGLS